MKNIYRRPTVRKLAAALADTGDAPTERPAPEVTEPPASVSTFQYLLCGTLQLLVFLGYAYTAVVLTLNPLHVLFLRVRCTDRQGSHDPVQQHPVCTDLLSIGEGSIVRKDSIFHCHRARAGRIETGRLTLSPEVFVGEKTVLARRACNDQSDFWFKGST